jgi:hypothetical protein
MYDYKINIEHTFILVSLTCDLMNKPILFAITAVVLLAAIVTVTLYTTNAANAQGNATSAGGKLKNMTNATGGKLKNMTSGGMGALKGAIGGK